MNEMAFHIMGLGAGGASGGGAFLAFQYNGEPLLFSAYCQGTGSSKVWTKKPFTIKNGLNAGEEVLFNFTGAYIVTLEIPDFFIGWGTVSFSMKIEEQDSGTLRYQVERKPEVLGGSSGIKITTKFDKKHDLSKGNDIYLWHGIWNGWARPHDWSK